MTDGHRARAVPDDDAFEDQEDDFKTLTREEAQALRAQLPQISPWRVVVAQAAAGVAMAAVMRWFIGNMEAVWSALYGAGIVLMQSVLMARGLTKLSAMKANATAFNFMVWELMKIVIALAMLVAATWIVPGLSWLAMLVTMVVCMKMNWLALLWQGRVMTNRS